MDRIWEFWIDVGGTFTDCLGRSPQGKLFVHKLLSTGVYLGTVGDASTPEAVLDASRQSDPEGFFEGWRFVLAPENSTQKPVETLVRRFDAQAGRLHFSAPLDLKPVSGQRYALVCGLQAPTVGIRWLLGCHLQAPTGPIQVRLGTTRATNALLERQGAPTALLTTNGFKDVLRIAYQNRPRLFELAIRKPEDVYIHAVEAAERVSADGKVLQPLDTNQLATDLRSLRDKGIASLAVCFLHSYKNPAHEIAAGRLARELGFTQVSLSHELNPLPKIVPRGDTAVVDAYLTPVIRDYVARIQTELPDAEVRLMTSSGSLVGSGTFHGKDAILSGPAGGVVGAAHVAQLNGLEKIIGFDMGGTSTDVCRFDGTYERRYEMEVKDPSTGGGVRVTAPMLAVETVAAGGGSICWFDGVKPMVGPRSAGSDPGPACYGRGGPLCITDANLFLGRIIQDRFPFPLDLQAVEKRLDALIAHIASATGRRYSRRELAQGFIDIANANMAAPVRSISIARGYDVRDYALVSFGGAGSQHACAIASSLGMTRILCPAQGGVLSALGIGMADTVKFEEQSVARSWSWFNTQPEYLPAIFNRMEGNLGGQLLAEGCPEAHFNPPRRLLDMRYQGQESRITVPEPQNGDWKAAFETLHQQLYGFNFPGREIEVYAARMELAASRERPPARPAATRNRTAVPARHASAWLHGAGHSAAVFMRDDLAPGDRIHGPALVAEPIATIVVDPGWTAEVTAQNDILLTDHSPASPTRDQCAQDDSTPDPIELELFNNHFASIAEQMGATLQKTALSTNVKERLDFSCAVFTGNGDLVVNAPHIPVHLGAMSECVKCLMEDIPAMKPGDIYVTNDPYRGGSHLPDVTVITPVFARESSSRPSFFVASRAHHSEIGGITPGSMPPFSKTLAEEGVLIRAFRLAHDNQSRESELRHLLTSGPHPSRSPDDNIADINAQSAANQMGVSLLLDMVQRHGLDKVQAYMRHIQSAAEQKMRAALLSIPEGLHRFSDQLDDGSTINVTITIQHTPQATAHVDFTGTGPVLEGNLNANRAIVTSAVIYCFRCLIRDPIPLNSGVLSPITILLPTNCLLNPTPHPDPVRCPAVVGGNVETSQRVVDVLFGALGVVAASQGTMNNFLFGRSGERAFGYYETIGGGSGAGPDFDGTSAVHTHMTNTRLTDPEVLELRYPVRLRRCEIRSGSGGEGAHRGGDGMVREVEFLEPVQVSLLTSRRTTQPPGLKGGGPGASGVNQFKPASSNKWQTLPPSAQLEVNAGDVVRIETPGGGGCGVMV